MPTPNTPVPRQSTKPSHRARLVLIVLGIALIALAVFGILQRVHARHELSNDTDRQAVPIVAILMPKAAPEDQSLTLPGTVNSWQDAQIYARTTGYVAKWYVDIGTRVKKDQRLADLDTPDVDNELLQGQAQMRTDEANEKLAKVTADRYEVLVKQGLVALQTGDQYVAQLNADIATVEADRANVAKLENMEQFKYITAPFDGVITQRTTDVGALINAGQGPGAALFHVADTHRLRIYVSVPQSYASGVRIGMPAELVFSEHPGRRYPATVAFTADALDPASRT
ncbi:MAG TPA: efflux RND transporter periplasmic adaptor subunit, partial [Rhodanobacter sp.]